MTDSRETVRRKQFRDHAAAAADPPDQPARTAGRLTYHCPSCGRQRQTTANQPPEERCPTCILDHQPTSP